jgi:hypothetical protein
VSTRRFDVLAYAASAHGRSRSDLEGVGAPLSPELRRALEYLARRQGETTTWLSLVLVTPTHKDARITAFLSAWAYERHWVADSLAALTGDRPHPAPQRNGPRRVADRLAPLGAAVAANRNGGALPAVQMAERYVDGLFLEAMLDRAEKSAPDPVAADLGRMRATVARQQRFFAEAAVERLAASATARRLARRALTARAWPIGAEREPEETAAVLAALFAADPDWAAPIDSAVDRLPGQGGLRIAERTAANPGRPPLRILLRPAAALGSAAAGITRRRKGRGRSAPG